MNKIIFYSLVLSLIATSCQKDIDGELPDDSVPGADSYLPLTDGTFWNYKQTGYYNNEYTMRPTNRKQTVDGINYTVVTSDFNGTISEGLMARNGANYYLRTAGNSPNTGVAFDFTQIFLNDKESAGYTWDFTGGQAGGLTAKLPGKIIARDLSMTIAGKNYKDVIHTQIKLKYIIPVMGEREYMIYDYYVAKGIGIIKIDSETPSGMIPAVSSVVELQDYSIK